jgi:hypothetical protein
MNTALRMGWKQSIFSASIKVGQFSRGDTPSTKKDFIPNILKYHISVVLSILCYEKNGQRPENMVI